MSAVSARRVCWLVGLPLLLGTLSFRAATTELPFVDTPFGPAVAAALGDHARGDTSQGNRVVILDGGYEVLLVRIHLIRQARRSIEVQTFIWTNDECGRLVMFELIEAARRGVKVRVIADQPFSEQDPALTAFLATADPNLEIKHYRPTLARIRPSFVHTVAAGLWSFKAVNQRMHSKVMLFDEAILITGGRNLENAYFDHSTELNYRDRDVLVVGPAAREAAETFEEFWGYRHSVPSRELIDVAAEIENGKFRRYDTRADYDFGAFFGELVQQADDAALITARFVQPLRPVKVARFLSDRPGKSRGFFGRTARITRELKAVLEEARTEILMQTPYLVLSGQAQTLIQELREERPQLRIRISTNSFASTDNLLAYSANYRLRNRYVQDLGLEVHEFRPKPAALPLLFPRYDELAAFARERRAAGKQSRDPFLCLHAKSLVIDDRIAFIGSFNLDPRSQNLNTEVGLLIEDEVVARELRDQIERDLRPENSWVIGRRSLPLRLEAVNGLVGGILSLAPMDVWPIQNTSSFELRPGGRVVPPDDPTFQANYREVGSFPGTEGMFTTKEILTRLYKVVGPPLTPVL
ncbi:phospholipase D family protein [Opitutus terrae]|uniref:Phospholipase D/Transphosphatidylase n=1 Tax=Opitutus terrae (strain DSM 11246 / JCM 15787 / PB90-1) TaxID=452637 RepID=B1ZY10_OPITP|nr:phospholipase D family protein [Opitutus terrae]ACB75209.1 phospholipase D/Transphosphatidylase [Opitutus terrae PB90-1]